MVWGCIQGVDKGLLIRWERAWGTIKGDSFVEHILPVILDYYYEAQRAANTFFNRLPPPALPHLAPPVTVPPYPEHWMLGHDPVFVQDGAPAHNRARKELTVLNIPVV